MTRRLAPRECVFLRHYFGSSLAIDRISLSRALGARSWCPYGSHIRLASACFESEARDAEVALDAPFAAAIFAHEALHVWQRQGGRAVTRQGALLQTLHTLRLHDPYRYDRSVNCPELLLSLFQRGNIEQQGQIFQDYVHAELCGRNTARFVAIASFVRSGRVS